MVLQINNDGDSSDDDSLDDDEAEETALESYQTPLDEDNCPVDEYIIFKTILHSKCYEQKSLLIDCRLEISTMIRQDNILLVECLELLGFSFSWWHLLGLMNLQCAP